MMTLLHDLRYGCRVMVNNPGFTMVAVLTLALGIGANSTIFSWINSTLLDPIPGISSTHDLISLMKGERRSNPTPPFSYLDYSDLSQRNRSFTSLLAYHDTTLSLTGSGKAERIHGTMASANYFQTLDVRPILGRGFLPEEGVKPGSTPVVVISYGLWQSRFGGNPSVIGMSIGINRHPFTIVGVAPPAFQGCKIGLRSDLWVPLTMDPVITGWGRVNQRSTSWLQMLGRLKPGIDPQQAESDMNLLMQQIVTEHPDSHRGANQITLDPLWKSPFGAGAHLYSLLPMLLAIAGIVLLLACANVANLLLIRSVARRRELAIRLSIGATRGRLVRQLLLESLMLSVAGGAMAAWLTSWTAGTFTYFVPPASNGVVFNIKVDYRVLLATLVISIISGTLFGILPALRSSNLTPVTVLKEEAISMTAGGRKMRLSDGLVMAQIALSMLLLICTGLFIRSLLNAQNNDPGFDYSSVLLNSMDLRTVGYTPSAGIEFERQLLANIESLPGVVAATLSNWIPMGSGKHTETIDVEGYVSRPHESMEVQRANIGPNFFRTLRIPLVAGRDITEKDIPQSALAIVVNQALANRYWPGQNAIGKRIRIHEQWRTVVGVARNSVYSRMKEGPQPQVFIPLFQDFYYESCILTRTTGDPQALAAAVEKTVHELNGDLALYDVTTLKSTVQIANILEQIAATVVGILGLVALSLATVGIYGVVAYATSRRTREVGIRMALGAGKAQIYQLVLSQGLRLIIIGLAVGLALALISARFLRSMLFGVMETDMLTLVTVVVLLSIVALGACCIPARRAANTETTWALRYE